MQGLPRPRAVGRGAAEDGSFWSTDPDSRVRAWKDVATLRHHHLATLATFADVLEDRRRFARLRSSTISRCARGRRPSSSPGAAALEVRHVVEHVRRPGRARVLVPPDVGRVRRGAHARPVRCATCPVRSPGCGPTSSPERLALPGVLLPAAADTDRIARLCSPLHGCSAPRDSPGRAMISIAVLVGGPGPRPSPEVWAMLGTTVPVLCPCASY